jgi:hypothetical protein
VHASVRAGEWPEKLSAPGLDSETSDSTHADQRATAPPQQVSIVGMWTVGFYHSGNLLSHCR